VSILNAFGFSQDFGPTAVGVNFHVPLLQLQFALRAGVTLPERRTPVQKYGELTLGDFGADTEQCVGQVPMFGRKHIVVRMTGDKAMLGFRVAAVRGLNVLYPVQETTEGTAGATAAGSSVRFQLNFPDADYLLLYATGATEIATVNWTVTGYD
jgi:hypothetical protein